jgi:chromosome segregation ATPase
MSNRLGEHGRTHAILAQDVTEISKECNEFVNEVVDVIGSISRLNMESIRESMDRISGDHEESKINDGSIQSGIALITEAYGHFQDSSAAVFEHADSLKKMIWNADSDLSFLDDLIARLNEYHAELEELLGLLDPFKSQISEQDHEIDQISDRYTMKVEREIHDMVFNETDNRVGGNAHNETADNDDLGDNIELF